MMSEVCYDVTQTIPCGSSRVSHGLVIIYVPLYTYDTVQLLAWSLVS